MGPPASTTVITVAIVEDEREMRESLAVLLSGTPGYRCTSAFASIEDALDRICREPPDVALVDIGLPGVSGIEGIRLLKERVPKVLAVVLTVYADDERIFDALCSGARGYLLKNTPPAKLLEGIAEAVKGGAPMSPEVARRVIDLFQKFRPPQQAAHNLTPHELRLLKLLVEGHNYKTAAGVLGVTYYTVCFHVQNIYEKLHVHSKSEAVAKALKIGLVR